ncbi:chemotaxis protein CheB [Pseudoduganella ginsengisoli]|uniref:protein-glutamate O-methyltransferase n=1 Tax=Pseudoduganella ginsengisoli TaxID=1462440 RepID=A0A6L6PSU1_9BURK|nr:chemotaxis protein CheB [Pseudoduganella ginsengisoli]MTW00603.1 chemotaxis protein CheB [Pseudoduganella ginsengisoli]
MAQAPLPKQPSQPRGKRTAKAATTTPSILRIAAIGASAGGLEALEQFFRPAPTHTGLAFVVIQHQDPSYQGMLPELLRRFTSMPVLQISHGMIAEADHIYVVPSGQQASMSKEMFVLEALSGRPGLALPIDQFFLSLAQEHGANAIGLVLSGMGADGSLGLTAIRSEDGLTLVQEPSDAKFDSMPSNAIKADETAIVAPADKLMSELLRQLTHEAGYAAPHGHAAHESPLHALIALLHRYTGHDFSSYKTNTLYRRIGRRIALHQLADMGAYVDFLHANPQEIHLLFKELLIGVTHFFRDEPLWTGLLESSMPAICRRHGETDRVMRAWVPACSTGEEAYSLAIIFKETLEQMGGGLRLTLQVFATDLDADAIARARLGRYPEEIEDDVNAQRLERYFIKEEKSYRVCKEIRDMVVFAQQNMISDPPFTKLDVLMCRNLLIYLDADIQAKLIPLFHYALNPGGLLILGSAETIGRYTNLFASIDSKARIYRRIDSQGRQSLQFPTRTLPAMPPDTVEVNRHLVHRDSLQQQAEQFLLDRYVPAAVLINAEGDVIYINGRTGKYLEPAAGKANWNIYAMAREELRHALSSCLHRAMRNNESSKAEGVRLDTGGSGSSINVVVHPTEGLEHLRGMYMVVFEEIKETALNLRSRRPKTADAAYLAELKRTREDMQSMREELTSANEELQSTNEELQSTNEELTTTKEETQSMNEELQVVNAELHARMEDLAHANNDLKNLLNSTEIATVFLDEALNVRRFTTHSTHIFRLIPSDVGRPLSDITNILLYPELQDDAKQVLATSTHKEKQVSTKDGQWYKARIMPYRTSENVVDGLVMTFLEITELKVMEAEMRNAAGRSN